MEQDKLENEKQNFLQLCTVFAHMDDVHAYRKENVLDNLVYMFGSYPICYFGLMTEGPKSHHLKIAATMRVSA